MFSLGIKIIGLDKITAFSNILKKFLQGKGTLTNRFYAFFGEHLIKHCPDANQRKAIFNTFKRMNIDLTKFLNDTTRIPSMTKAIGQAGPVQKYFQINGAKLRLEATIADPARFFADIVNDKRSPLKQFFDEEMKKVK